MNRVTQFWITFWMMTALAASGQVNSTMPEGNSAGKSFTVWQLPNQAPAQMMSYVLRTRSGNLIIIDGGRDSDAGYLKQFIRERGGEVKAWFITHPHDDHIGALTSILLNPEGIAPGTLYASLPDTEWMERAGDTDRSYTALKDALQQTNRPVKALTLGETIEVDGICIRVLGIHNPEILQNPINNSSVVLRVHDEWKSVLFLADLGMEGGEKCWKDWAEYLPHLRSNGASVKMVLGKKSIEKSIPDTAFGRHRNGFGITIQVAAKILDTGRPWKSGNGWSAFRLKSIICFLKDFVVSNKHLKTDTVEIEMFYREARHWIAQSFCSRIPDMVSY